MASKQFYKCHIHVIKLLLSKGANIYDKIKGENTCLIQAIRYQNFNGIELLKKWPLTMFIVVLQELFVYHILDCISFIDFYEYCYE